MTFPVLGEINQNVVAYGLSTQASSTGTEGKVTLMLSAIGKELLDVGNGGGADNILRDESIERSIS